MDGAYLWLCDHTWLLAQEVHQLALKFIVLGMRPQHMGAVQCFSRGADSKPAAFLQLLLQPLHVSQDVCKHAVGL